MKVKSILSLLLLTFSLFECSSEKINYPFIGTYVLEVNDDSRQAFATVRAANMQWPEMSFYEDGTYIMINPEGTRKGVFTWEDGILTLTCKEFNFENATGKESVPKTFKFEQNFRLLLQQGTSQDRWIRLNR